MATPIETWPLPPADPWLTPEIRNPLLPRDARLTVEPSVLPKTTATPPCVNTATSPNPSPLTSGSPVMPYQKWSEVITKPRHAPAPTVTVAGRSVWERLIQARDG